MFVFGVRFCSVWPTYMLLQRTTSCNFYSRIKNIKSQKLCIWKITENQMWTCLCNFTLITFVWVSPKTKIKFTNLKIYLLVHSYFSTGKFGNWKNSKCWNMVILNLPVFLNKIVVVMDK